MVAKAAQQVQFRQTRCRGEVGIVFTTQRNASSTTNNGTSDRVEATRTATAVGNGDTGLGKRRKQ